MTIPPASAPIVKVAVAKIITSRRASPSAVPIVSTIEKPHGDQAPAKPATAAVTAPKATSKLSMAWPSGSR